MNKSGGIVLALVICGFLVMDSGVLAQVTYTIKGKQVSKDVYDAVTIVNESLPLINSGRYQEAVDKLEKALQLDPDLPEAQHNMGLALAKQGKAEQAIPHFKKVVDSGAELPNAWMALAGIYQNSGKFEQSAEVYKDALTRFPESTWTNMPEIHYNYGLALGKLGRSDQAVRQLKLALPAKANMSGIWLSLGAIYQASGKIPESISAYKEFLNRFPKDSEVNRVRGVIALMEKEYKLAQEEKKSGAANDVADYYAEITERGVKKWAPDMMPLRVYFQRGEEAHGYKPNYEDIFKQAFQDWATASKGKISVQYVTDPSNASINASFTHDPSKLANSAEGGEAQIFSRSDGSIARATIYILTVPITPLKPVTDNLIRFVSLHEIGHALGIAGHSTTPGDIMFFSSNVTDDKKDLSERDAKTIRRLYSGGS